MNFSPALEAASIANPIAMGLAMEAASKAGLKFIVLDRANPINGIDVEGPVLQGGTDFVGFHSIPIRHGMTVGELALMFMHEHQSQLTHRHPVSNGNGMKPHKICSPL